MLTSPRVVLLCHDGASLDAEGLARWLASTFRLVGLITLAPSPGRVWRAGRREWRRSGALGTLDVLAFRAYYQWRYARADAAWTRDELSRLREAYPTSLVGVPRLQVRDPNSEPVREFLTACHADILLARCKVLLKPDIFTIPRVGTFVLHPGICPEYRNAHGCFWALVNRDLDRVGMTLLQVDPGVDTGPMYLQASYPFDERHESHVVIQQRVVLENLDAIGRHLEAIAHGDSSPLVSAGRRSAVWGQPRLSAYCRWQRAARRSPTDVSRVASLS